MDEQTALLFALQLVALFSIAGALLLYLLCKIRAGPDHQGDEFPPGGGKPVLVTSSSTALGLQIAVHLASKGFRVFAGLRSNEIESSAASRVIRAWQKHRESLVGPMQGALIVVPVDVTREDILHESVDIIRAHLPAGDDGLWAVINTSGICYRGRLDQQDISHWDAMLKNSAIGLFRIARTYQGLLRNTGGRIITLGASNVTGTGLVAYTAARYAVEGASMALDNAYRQQGIKTVILNPEGISPEMLYVMPRLNSGDANEVTVDINGCIEYQPSVLTSCALHQLDIALTTANPKQRYVLNKKTIWSRFM